MIIENSFDVDADPDRVFDFLQNPHNVATCFPGAELTEDLGDDSYRGKVKIKLGPVTAAFSGIAKITEKDAAERLAVLVAEGKDARGSGTAKATATMKVEATETGSSVLLRTDLTISGKLAQFGRGIMADVSGRMVNDLAVRVRERIESESEAAAEAAPAGAVAAEAGAAEAATTEATPAESAPAPAPAPAAAEAGTAADKAGSAGAEAASAETAPAQSTPEAEVADSGALSGATTDTATASAPPQAGSEAGATTPAATSAKAAATTPAAKAPATSSEPAGAIKASTLLKVMVTGMFRRLFARLRGRSHDAESPKA